MVPKILAINSVLLVLSTIFLIIALGHAILAWTGTLLIYATVIFLLLLASEFILSLYS